MRSRYSQRLFTLVKKHRCKRIDLNITWVKCCLMMLQLLLLKSLVTILCLEQWAIVQDYKMKWFFFKTYVNRLFEGKRASCSTKSSIILYSLFLSLKNFFTRPLSALWNRWVMKGDICHNQYWCMQHGMLITCMRARQSTCLAPSQDNTQTHISNSYLLLSISQLSKYIYEQRVYLFIGVLQRCIYSTSTFYQ